MSSAPQRSRLGPYTIQAELGRGAAGVVFRVVDDQGRPWALKQLTAVKDARARRRFEREIEALTKLEHPGVVKLQAHGEARGRPYLVMALVEGETLDQKLARAGHFDPREAAELALGLSEALVHAHAQDVLHRDLKPANVLLDREGAPLLTDFGLTHDMAAAHHSLTQTGAFLGTPGYWPPELAVGELDQVGPASDVYGLGAILYAMLTGRPPIRADTLTEILARTTSVPPTPPSRINPAVDPELEAICLRCLEKPPAKRYPDAQSLAEALGSYLTTDRAATPRRPLVVAAGVLVAGVLAAGLLVVAGSGPSASVKPAPTTPVAERLEQARALRKDNQFTAALELLDRILVDYPQHLDTREERGIARALAGDQPGALADSGLVLEQDDQRPIAWRVQASALIQLGELERALEGYSRALELDPSQARAWGQRGMALRALGQRERARQDFTRALELDPELTVIYSALGSMAYEDQDFPQALEHLNEAIRRDPTQVLDLANRGSCYLNQERYAQAEADFLEVTELAPDDPGSWNLLASSRMGLVNLRGAAQAFTQGLQRTRALQLLVGRAECYRELSEFPAALADLDEALALDPAHYGARRHRADVHELAGDTAAALTDYETALAHAPADGRASLLNNYALALSQARRFRDAAAVRSELIELDDGWESHWNRASVRLRLQELAGALEDLNRSLELGPEPRLLTRIRASRGRVRWALGEREAGLDDLRWALERQPHALHALWIALLAGEPDLLEAFDDAGDVWGPLAAWGVGRLSEAELLAAVDTVGDEQQRNRWRCQVLCYLGLAAEVAGDAARAQQRYQAALDTGQIKYLEWSWSLNGLTRLE